MTDATRNQLQQAYRLIQQEELDKAIAILKPVVASQPNNADAWWLMANAVSEPEEARQALQSVLRLNPGHKQAQELLDQLDEQFPESAITAPGTDVSFDDLFSGAPTPATTASSSFSSSDLDDLLGGEPEPAPLSQSTDNFDDLFGAPESTSTGMGDLPFGDDPFATEGPGFVKEAEESSAKAKKPGREKKQKPAKAAKAPKTPPTVDALEAERRANRRTSPFLLFVLVLLIIVVIGGGVTLGFLTGFIGGPRGGDQTAQATSVSIVSTETTPSAAGETATAPVTGATEAVTPDTGATAIAAVPTTEMTPGADTPTTAAPTASGATNPLQALRLAGVSQAILSDFVKNNFQNTKVNLVQSSLGKTLQVEACGNVGPALQSKINQAMDIIAQNAIRARNDVNAAGVAVVSCAKPDTKLFQAFAPMDALASYVEGNMVDKSGYRASWKRS